MNDAQSISVIDSHTAGEPTRVVIGGLPDLGSGDVAARARRFSAEQNGYRQSVILEPRGTDWLVGALLLPPSRDDFDAAVIFFNNVGTLGMCGHGLIGVVETLRHLGRVDSGVCRIETPVGHVSAEIQSDGRVTVANVESYRWKKNVIVHVRDLGTVTGDIAYGGNWFFLTAVDEVIPEDLGKLLRHAKQIRAALDEQQITGENGGLIDHIELVGPADRAVADARSFVLCPGGEYDRSPCGTGTSAKLACLAADAKLAPGALWRQQSICGGVFEGRYREGSAPGHIMPSITGRAYVTSEATLRFDSTDPYRQGLVMSSG